MLWPAEVDDVALIRLLGETIVAGLGRGTTLGDVLLQANNVTVEHDDAAIAAGDFVTLTIGGVGDWSPEISWVPDDPEAPTLVNDDVLDEFGTWVLGADEAFERFLKRRA